MKLPPLPVSAPETTPACLPIACSDTTQQRYSFIYWLWRLQQASTALQQPLDDFLFRPTESTVFMERPLTSAALHERSVGALQRFSLYHGVLSCRNNPQNHRDSS